MRLAGRKPIGDFLVDAGIITATTLERALTRQKGSGKQLGSILEDMGVITDAELVDALAKQLNMKSAKNILGHEFAPQLLERVSVDFALERKIFPLMEKDGVLAIAVSNPFDIDTFDFLAQKTGLKILPVLATDKEILAAIKGHYLKGATIERKARKILVVEDSPPVATIIKVALQREGFDVFMAMDGLEGLKQALTHLPDLIICDSIMPKMDGFGMFRALKGSPQTAEIPIILITSKASPEDEQKALEYGFFDFVAKPVMPMRVISRVKRAFNLLDTIQGSGKAAHPE